MLHEAQETDELNITGLPVWLILGGKRTNEFMGRLDMNDQGTKLFGSQISMALFIREKMTPEEALHKVITEQLKEYLVAYAHVLLTDVCYRDTKYRFLSDGKDIFAIEDMLQTAQQPLKSTVSWRM